mgnify:FL=1
MYRRSSDAGAWFYLFLMLAVIVFAVVGFFGGLFVDEAFAIRALKTNGFSSITILDRDWCAVALRGCSTGDAAKFTARAVNPVGDTVEVCVCAGWLLKGATIRTQ